MTTSSPAQLPSRRDPVVAAASALVGGPAGTRVASGRGFWWAGSVLAMLAVLMLAGGVVQKQHCRDQGVEFPDQFFHACYSDIAVQYAGSSLGQASRSGLADTAGPDGLAIPVVPALSMWVVSAFVPETDEGSAADFFDVSALLLAAALAAGVVALAMVLRRRGRAWDAAHLALSPVLLTAALISYDLLAPVLLVGALAAWGRRRVVWAGVLYGLAVAAAAVLAVGAVVALVMAWRYPVRRPERARVLLAAVTAVLTWLGLRAAVLGPDGVFAGVRAWWQQTPGYGSPWLLPDLLGRVDATTRLRLPSAQVNQALTTGLLIVLVVTLLVGCAQVLTRLRPGGQRPERLRVAAALALALTIATLLTARALPVQAGLVLLPLIGLAAVPWRDHLIWAAAELTYFVGVWLFIAADTEANRGLTPGLYLLLLLLRVAAWVWLAVSALRGAQEELAGAGGQHVSRAPGLASSTR